MSSSATKRHGIAKVAQQLQHVDQDDPAAVARVAHTVEAAVSKVWLGGQGCRFTPACVAAALQCAGWLVKAMRTGQELDAKRITFAVDLCITTAGDWLDTSTPDLGLLQAVTQPAAGGKAPGITTWLPWVAQSVLDAWAVHEPSPLVNLARWAAPVLHLWVRLLWGAHCNRGSLALHPAAWLESPLLQLAHAAQQEASSKRAGTLQWFQALVFTASPGFSLPAHPQLCALVTGRPGDATLGATAAAALRQDLWWHAMITTHKVVAQRNDSLPSQSKHPWARVLAANGTYGYPPQDLDGVSTSVLVAWSQATLHCLLLAELWDLWPWQLQQLQQLQGTSTSTCCSDAAGDTSTPATTSSSSDDHHTGSSPSSSRGCSSTLHGPVGASSSMGSQTSLSGTPSNHSSSSRSASSGATQHGGDGSAWGAPRMPKAYLDFPVLPHGPAALGNHPPAPPVSLQQLQMVVHAWSLGNNSEFSTASLLMALLLQRADPGLRAQFLGSPLGSFWLDRLTGVPQQERQRWLPAGWRVLVCATVSEAREELMAAVRGAEPGSPLGSLPAACASLLALAWSHLERQGSDTAAGHTLGPCLFATHRECVLPGDAHNEPRECLVTTMLPCSSFRFLRGLAPSLELFAATEQLIREFRDHPGGLHQQLQAVAVLLHAAVQVWVPRTWQVETTTTTSSSSSGSSSSSSNSNSSSRLRLRGRRSGMHGTSMAATNPSFTNATSATTTTTSSSSSSTNSGPSSSQGPCSPGPGTLQALSSLVVSVTCGLCALAPACNTHDQVLHTLGVCGLIATDTLHLAAHQLQQPQANRLAAMQLAGAGQRLAAACADGLGQRAEKLLASNAMQWISTKGGSSSADAVVNLTAASLGAMQMRVCQLESVVGAGGSQRAVTSSTGVSPLAQFAARAAATQMRLQRAGWYTDPRIPQLQLSVEEIKLACGTGLQLVGCSNRACTNLSGPSAEGLVAGRKGVRCGGCRVARYCSPACQQEDWAQHRRVCRRLAAAGVQGTSLSTGA